MVHLIGSYECKVDTKGRIMMPVSLKKQLSKLVNEGFVLKRAVFNPCIEMYPVNEWSKLMNKLNGLNRFNKKNNDFIRRFTAGLKKVDKDISRTFLIPKDLIKYLDIPLQGGLNPEALLSNKESLIKEIKRYLDIFKDHPYVFNLGHGILPDTRVDMVYELVHIVRNYK